jgi:hypothetical protein
MKLAQLMGLLFLCGCASGFQRLPEGWETTPAAATIGDVCAHFDCSLKPASGEVHVNGNRLFNETKALTPPFAAIDSFDVSLERREVVFSAKRTDNFDIGLVSLDGSDIHWVPSDAADEVAVQWAPRGNKVSYILRTPSGNIVRTVHIPTATPLSVDFPGERVDRLAWEPKAERFAVVVESPEASQHVVSMTYAGEQRKTLVGAAAHLDVSLDPIAGVLVMRPNDLHYNERLPLVVWIDRNPLEWSDAHAALMRNARVAIAFGPEVSETFWSEVANVPWIDAAKTYVVGDAVAVPPGKAATIISADTAIPRSRYARRGNKLFVPPSVIQSFAAAFIADDLKGTAPPNGRR